MAIFWVSGNSRAGKTTLAKALIGDQDDVVLLDGDEVRKKNNNYDFSKEGREKHCLDVAKEAKDLSADGNTVIVSVIAPYRELRKKIKELCGCTFLYLMGGQEPNAEYPYEWPDESLMVYRVYISKLNKNIHI